MIKFTEIQIEEIEAMQQRKIDILEEMEEKAEELLEDARGSAEEFDQLLGGDIEEEYAECLNDVYGDVEIGDIFSVNAARVLEEMDEDTYRIGLNEYIENRVADLKNEKLETISARGGILEDLQNLRDEVDFLGTVDEDDEYDTVEDFNDAMQEVDQELDKFQNDLDNF